VFDLDLYGHSTEFDHFPPPLKVKAGNRAQRLCKERNRCRAYRRVWVLSSIRSFPSAIEGQGVQRGAEAVQEGRDAAQQLCLATPISAATARRGRATGMYGFTPIYMSI